MIEPVAPKALMGGRQDGVGDPGVVMERALDGDRAATQRLLEIARTIAVRYCRARVGRQRGSYAQADALARDVLHAFLSGLPDVRDRVTSCLAFLYATAAGTVDRNRLPSGGIDGAPDTMARLVSTLPRRERETVVLRFVVGLSRHHTADALGVPVGRIGHAEAQALISLRAAGRSLLGRPDRE